MLRSILVLALLPVVTIADQTKVFKGTTDFWSFNVSFVAF